MKVDLDGILLELDPEPESKTIEDLLEQIKSLKQDNHQLRIQLKSKDESLWAAEALITSFDARCTKFADALKYIADGKAGHFAMGYAHKALKGQL